MTKSEAIKIINKKLSTPHLNNRNTHFANVNSAKEVWWFDIPTSKAFSVKLDYLHFLLYQPKNEEILHLKVPTILFRENRHKFVIRKEKGTISLELSAKIDTFLHDVRPKSGRVNFREFVQ